MKEIIVIKIGSSVLMTARNKLDEFRIAHVAKQIFALKEKDVGIVLVISGAVAYGSNFIDISDKDCRLEQAAAGIGQMHITSTFNTIFIQSKLQLAQILLTKDSLKSEEQKKSFNQLISFYIESGFIPFINENDVIDLNSFGGNDHLAAEVTVIIGAKKLLILSTMQGSVHGVGGGRTKQEAIKMLTKRDIEANIVNGKTKDILLHTLL